MSIKCWKIKSSTWSRVLCNDVHRRHVVNYVRCRLVCDDTDCTVNYSELFKKKKYIYIYLITARNKEHVKPKLVYICEASQLNNRTHVPLQECNYTNELARLGSHEYMNRQLRFEWLKEVFHWHCVLYVGPRK
jgi:hypothetical protein